MFLLNEKARYELNNRLRKIAIRLALQQDQQNKHNFQKWINTINLMDEHFLILKSQSELSSSRRKLITKTIKQFSSKSRPLVHELKTHPGYFLESMVDEKLFELRQNDRNFQRGDILHLREWNPGNSGYTGAHLFVRVGYIASRENVPFFDLKDFVIMSITR